MALAAMLATDKDALICDLAETYHIFDYRSLPVSLLATLAVGLRDNTRIKMAIAGERIGLDTALLASAVDLLGLLVWSQSKDAASGKGRPASILAALCGKQDAPGGFDTPEEFWAAREKILNS